MEIVNSRMGGIDKGVGGRGLFSMLWHFFGWI